MTEYTRSHLALWSQLDLLGLISLAVAALALFALARQYYLLFSVPSAIQIRPWVPMPDDLPEGPMEAYGARALKSTYQPNLFAGMNGSVTFHVVLIASGLLIARMMTPTLVELGPEIKLWDSLTVIPVPPAIDPEVPDAVAYQPEPVGPPKLFSGMAIPVPDSRVSLNATILSQDDLSDLIVTDQDKPDGSIWGRPGRPDGSPEGKGLYGATDDDTPVSPDIVERLPELVTIPAPQYPEFARASKAEGVVRLNVLVGRDGRVRDARVVESIPMLDTPAVNAARAAVFKPAIWNGNPVAVWVTVPIRFSLTER